MVARWPASWRRLGGSADAQGRRRGRLLQPGTGQEGVATEKREANSEVDLSEPVERVAVGSSIDLEFRV